MIFYRHFCERKDFEIKVITDNSQVDNFQLPYSYLKVSKSKLWTRLSRTRLYKLFHTWEHLYGYLVLPKGVKKFAKDFSPDAVLTVAGNWNWMALIAKGVANELKVPLIGSFMDWWYYNNIRHAWMDKIIEKRFYKFYASCDLALCISDGMKDALGAHKNSIVLHPMGSDIKEESVIENHFVNNGHYKVAFGGNLGDWYGKMIESLLTLKTDGVEYSIYGNNPSWSEEFDIVIRKNGTYHGQVSFDILKQEMSRQDALILLMGFDEENRKIEQTSFKSKFLDYLSFGKPILVWGPEYCTAVSLARRYDSAEICTSPLAADFLTVISALKSNEQRQQQLVENGKKMHRVDFNPDTIHKLLVESVQNLIEKRFEHESIEQKVHLISI